MIDAVQLSEATEVFAWSKPLRNTVFGGLFIAFCTLQNNVQIFQAIILLTPGNTHLQGLQAEEGRRVHGGQLGGGVCMHSISKDTKRHACIQQTFHSI